MVALEDLEGMSPEEILEHIAVNYNPQEGSFPYEEEAEKLRKELHGIEILIAYESVGSWGCDSSSFFLFRKDGKLFENHAGHCSCYEFEGQWEPEETDKESLLRREFKYDLGGYDRNSDRNAKAMKEAVGLLP